MTKESCSFSTIYSATPLYVAAAPKAAAPSFENLAAGTTASGQPVRITGLFIKTKGGGRTAFETEETEIIRLAVRLKVPIVRIEAPATAICSRRESAKE